MNAYRKLSEIMKAENRDIRIEKEINWLEMKLLFKKEPFRKYVCWFVTNLIIPEIGQVSPTLTHSGQERIM